MGRAREAARPASVAAFGAVEAGNGNHPGGTAAAPPDRSDGIWVDHHAAHRRGNDARGAVAAQGFGAVKIAWGPFGQVSEELDRELVAAAHKALPDGVHLLLDAGGSSPDPREGRDWRWALRTAEMLAEYDVKFFEEPLHPTDLRGFQRLTEASPVKIAGMEVVQCPETFRHWLRHGAVDVVQPDATHVGGLTAMLKIAVQAEEHGAAVVPHGWNTAAGLAADLHLAAVLDEALYIEYQADDAPYIAGISRGMPWFKPTAGDAGADRRQRVGTGMLQVPDGPGLGLHFDGAALAQEVDLSSPMLQVES